MKKEDFKLKVEGGTLSISGERKEEKEEKDKKHHRVERSYGAFVRSFALPEVVLSEKVSAEFKDGILTVHVPKDEKAKPKAIVVVVFRHAALLSKESPAVLGIAQYSAEPPLLSKLLTRSHNNATQAQK